MLNKVFLMGRLTADPELRHTQSNIPVVSFRLAVDRDYKDQNTGQRQADFINVIGWRQTAEFVSRYFAKGRMAVVMGRLQVREYTDRDNNRRWATEVVVDSVYFGDSKRDDGGGQPGGNYGGYQQGGYQQGGYGGGYSAPPPQQGYGGYPSTDSYGQAPGGYSGPPQGGYGAPPPPQGGGGYPPPPANGGGQFQDIDEDDGELPF